MNTEFIAHVRKADGEIQPLIEHLQGTAEIEKKLAAKMGLSLFGTYELLATGL